MNTQQEPVRNGYDATVSIIGAVFGTAHFIFQSAADLTAHAEGKIIEKVTKGEIKYQERVIYRKNVTEIKQMELINKINDWKSKRQSKNEVITAEVLAPTTGN